MTNSSTPEYKAWENMRKVCRRYAQPISPLLSTFDGFLAEVGPRPSPLHRLARLDAASGLTEGNVIWRTNGKTKPKKSTTQSTERAAWAHMKSVCFNPNNRRYPNNGGAGITVCDQWKHFKGFLADIGPRPGPDYRLSRKDLTKNFEPGNVAWEHFGAWGVLKTHPLDLPRDEQVRLSAIARANKVSPSLLMRLLEQGLTTKELLLGQSHQEQHNTDPKENACLHN